MSILLFPLKVVGLIGAGAALGVGWKLGSYLVDAAMADENVKRFFRDLGCACSESDAQEQGEPLWKRKFEKV